MKAPPINTHFEVWDDLLMREDYKELYYPDPDLKSKQDVILVARAAFQAAGYEVRQAEKAPYHPVYIFKLKAPAGPPRFVRHRDLQDHLREILSRVGLQMPKDSPLVDRNGDRVLVSFLLQPGTGHGGKVKCTRRVPVAG